MILAIAALGSRRIRLDRLLTRDAAQRLDLLADGGGQAGHGQDRRAASRRPVSSSAACSRNSTAARGLANQWRTLSLDRQHGLSPDKGSRRMLEKKPEAALFGLPGRMVMVGSRMPMPSRKPFRE